MVFKRSVFIFLLVVSSTFLGVEIAPGQVYSLQTNVLGWGTTNMNLEFGLKFPIVGPSTFLFNIIPSLLEMRGFAICLLLPECVIGSVNLMGVLIFLEFTE